MLLDNGLGVLGVEEGEAASQLGAGMVAAQDVDAAERAAANMMSYLRRYYGRPPAPDAGT